MIGKNIELRALSTDPWQPPVSDTSTPSGGIFWKYATIAGVLTGVAATLASNVGAIVGPAGILMPSINEIPGIGENDTVMSGDGIAQEGQKIGEGGELSADLERKREIVKDLVPVYQKAFAGPPWFEVSKCPTCPSGFSTASVGESCPVCGSGLTTEAYPANELYQDLLQRVTGSNSVVYIERLPNGQPVLGAIFIEMSPTEVLSKYVTSDGSPRITEPDWNLIRGGLPPRVLWLDEIFADVTQRSSGNLKNLQEVIERAKQATSSDTVAFRTINEGLLNKVRTIYGNRAEVTVMSDKGVTGGLSTFVKIRP
jgi:hypothetical protein